MLLFVRSVLQSLRNQSLTYILNAVRCPYVRSSVTLGVASSVANDVTMIIAGWNCGDWRHVATGCNALVKTKCGAVHPII